ncbi:hypothetical protein AAIH46_17820 [Rhizobium sp. 0TCS1.26]|uniref:hypothetical protein n=1 Tax=Rhizobium sp. 0TCS1.26 TaxID=3142623 RepID=UPI003D28662B
MIQHLLQGPLNKNGEVVEARIIRLQEVAHEGYDSINAKRYPAQGTLQYRLIDYCRGRDLLNKAIEIVGIHALIHRPLLLRNKPIRVSQAMDRQEVETSPEGRKKKGSPKRA